ncbi:hypothetical protein [Benzoatithermus flavus]|uniref:Uncharacterized protein n=1 Tax=Benzoatithermus flavus TaxID=3108223 RepID=A0ABU8XMY7_9PROT
MAGQGSEAGAGNEAHRGPGESGQAEGAFVPERPYEDFQPDVPRPYPHPETPDEEAAGSQRDKVERIGNDPGPG